MGDITHEYSDFVPRRPRTLRELGEMTDRELLQEWNRGSSEAGDRLCRRYVSTLRAHFRRKGVADADDLVQRVLLGLVKSRWRYRGDASFDTFVRTIARNVLVDLRREQSVVARRKHELDQESVPDDASPSISSQCDSQRTFSRVAVAWSRLPPHDVELLSRYAYDGVSGPSLATSLDITLPALRSRLRRARERLVELTNDVSSSQPPAVSA